MLQSLALEGLRGSCPVLQRRAVRQKANGKAAGLKARKTGRSRFGPILQPHATPWTGPGNAPAPRRSLQGSTNGSGARRILAFQASRLPNSADDKGDDNCHPLCHLFENMRLCVELLPDNSQLGHRDQLEQIVLDLDADHAVGVVLVVQQPLRQGILDQVLDDPSQRARPIRLVVTARSEQIHRLGRDLQRDLLLGNLLRTRRSSSSTISRICS